MQLAPAPPQAVPQAERPKPPGALTVLRQAYKDGFGKDVQETPTVSYVWMADQFGHFCLGFAITFVLSWLAAWLLYAPDAPPAGLMAACAAVNMAVWVAKEVRDYFREKENFARAHTEGQGQFPFNGREIIGNVVTALFYILTGAAVAGAVGFGPQWGVAALGVVLVPAIPLAGWWLRRKITFQQAGLPYLYRLANFPRAVGPGPGQEGDPVATIRAFIEPGRVPGAGGQPSHLILTGPLGAGKSSLAAGIGTEFAFRMGIGRYISLVKLLQSVERSRRMGAVASSPAGRKRAASPAAEAAAAAPAAVRGGELTSRGAQEFDDGRILWPWDACDLLIVDDVDDVIGNDPHAEGRGLRHQQRGEDIERVLQEYYPELLVRLRRVPQTVWVLSDRISCGAFQGLLAKVLGVPTSAVYVTAIQPAPTPGLPDGRSPVHH
jgi:hypothetical protein